MNFNLGIKEFKKGIIDYYYKRNKEKEKGEICRISHKCKFYKNNLFKRRSRFKNISNVTMHKVLKIKCGAIIWTKELEKWYPDKYVSANGCICCNKKSEDFEHFLLVCERFKTLREQTIKKYIQKEGLASLLEKVIEDKKVFSEFVKYVEKALEVRNQILKWSYG